MATDAIGSDAVHIPVMRARILTFLLSFSRVVDVSMLMAPSVWEVMLRLF